MPESLSELNLVRQLQFRRLTVCKPQVGGFLAILGTFLAIHSGEDHNIAGGGKTKAKI